MNDPKGRTAAGGERETQRERGARANRQGRRHPNQPLRPVTVSVPDGVRWAHLDIAGPAFNEGDPYGYMPKGGTGAGVRSLVQIALDVADGRL